MTGEQTGAAASGAVFDVPRRGPAFGKRFAVASDHPLVSSTALGVLQRGGNAADATIAAAALNVVLKPDRTHLGGDAFALVWRKRTGEVDCLNAGGRAPIGHPPGHSPGAVSSRWPWWARKSSIAPIRPPQSASVMTSESAM